MHRATLHRILTSLRDAGGWLLRSKIFVDVLHWNTIAAQLNAILNQPWPAGLCYLVTQEVVNLQHSCRPVKRWVLSPQGREFLPRLEADPKAMPVIPPYTRVLSAVTPAGHRFLARQRDRRRRQERRQKKQQWRGHPRSEEEYGKYNDSAHPRDRNFKNLTNLERIQILRTRAGLNKKREEANEIVHAR